MLLKPCCEEGEGVCEYHHPYDDEEETADDRDPSHIPCDDLKGGYKGIDREGGDKERQAKPEGVDREKSHPLGHGPCRTGIEEYGSQYRTDAGRPSRGKGHPNDERSQVTPWLIFQMELLLRGEEVQFKHPHDIKTKQDDQDPPCLLNHILVGQQKFS